MFYFLKVPFKDTHVYASVIGRRQQFIPLFATNYIGTLQYDKEMETLSNLDVLPKSKLNNYNKRLDKAFEKIKETTNGATHYI